MSARPGRVHHGHRPDGGYGPRYRAIQEAARSVHSTSLQIVRLTRVDDPIPRPLPFDQLVCDTNISYPEENYCYPIDLSETQGFTLKEIFGRAVQGTCLSTQGSEIAPPPICISAAHDLDVFTTEGVKEHKASSETFSRCLTIPPSGEFELLIPKQGPSRFSPVSVPPLYAERSITGHGQERGGVRVLLANPSLTDPISFVYFETLPWFMKPYLHTLKASIASVPAPESIKEMYYRPGLDRTRGSQLELAITVPAASTLELAYDFEKAILRYTEYPPDANRGREVAPAVIRLLNSNVSTTGKGMGGGSAGYLRTTSLMLPLPTPDFSMPYNVIILTSTVIALAFGTIYNMLVRRFVGADEVEGLSGDWLKERLRVFMETLRLRLGIRKDSEKEKDKEKKEQ